jgi:hypothetical protein
MFSRRQNKRQLRYLIADFFCIIFYIFILFSITACSANRKAIKNPELDHWDSNRRMYKNLFPPKYGYLEETEFDRVEFRKPHEKGVKEYSLVTDPKGDIDRTKGYNPSEHSVIPNFDILYNPTNEVQITWIRHASFLIQLGAEYQILVDPVMEQLDGWVGIFGKYSDIGTLYADSPLAVEKHPLLCPPKGGKEIFFSLSQGYRHGLVYPGHHRQSYDHLSACQSQVGTYIKQNESNALGWVAF